MASLLGVDTESTDARIRDAMVEGQRQVLRRLIEPVRAMAAKLVEEPKINKATGQVRPDICFRDTLVENVKEIAGLAPKLNIAGDPAIDQFAAEIKTKLASVTADDLREKKDIRKTVAEDAAAILKRLEAYKIA